ncbi:hypothetical protein [Qipengyuania spongiae]|uniref:Preprotein translocase subunit SecE n=1 Tax=Qipengyuania spongiae TaxID=2909673 RepID=A0ABY5SUZ2_9SPHN|nr:hypothetical protein [Qipengyuania spongiae]UVI38383.1 hypothetical protein L1F33_08925 [Qipengyuania spongiae]
MKDWNADEEAGSADDRWITSEAILVGLLIVFGFGAMLFDYVYAML